MSKAFRITPISPNCRVRSIAARSPTAAWQLLNQEEQRRLLDYVERAQGWVAEATLDAAAYTTSKKRKGEQACRVSLAG
jgi:hypothetical protein